MTLELRKLNLIEAILSIKDEHVFDNYEKLLRKARIEEHEAKMKPMTVEEMKERTLKSHQQYKEGKVTDIEDIIKESENW